MQTLQDEQERTLMANIFRLFFAIRTTTRSEIIVGEDTLDLAPETKDRSYPNFGKVPIPPVMTQQYEIMLTLTVLQPLRKRVLTDLQKIILANNPRSWFTIYLCIFILLHNCALITDNQYKYARTHGLKVGLLLKHKVC